MIVPRNLDTDVVTSFRRRLVWSGLESPSSSSSSTSTIRRGPGPRVCLQDIRKRYKRVLDRSLFTKGSIIRRLREADRLRSSSHHRCNPYHGEDIILGPDPNTSAVFTSINCVQCREQAEEAAMTDASEPAATSLSPKAIWRGALVWRGPESDNSNKPKVGQCTVVASILPVNTQNSYGVLSSLF
jgi:hypothetical protein